MYLSKVNINKDFKKELYSEQSYQYIGDDYWDWSIWIESKDEKVLDHIKSVTYHLHPTFPVPVRTTTNRNEKFILETSGWGTFTIYIVVNFWDESIVELSHNLVLKYPKELSVIRKKK